MAKVPRLVRMLLSAIGVVAAVLVMAALPKMLLLSGSGIVLDLAALPRLASAYVAGLWTGESFLYGRGGYEVSFFTVTANTFPTSFLYAGCACTTAVLLGTLLGTWMGAAKHRHIQDLLSALGAVPDFVMVLLLQISVVAFYQATGVRIARVASIARDEPALLLPLVVLAIIPTAYLLKGVSTTTRDIVTRDFITAARARGLGRVRLLRRHVLPHAVLHGQANAAKMAALVVGNLFIVEYLFSIPGITGVLFEYAWRGLYRTYQPQLVINSLFAILALFAALLLLVRLLNAVLMKASGRG